MFRSLVVCGTEVGFLTGRAERSTTTRLVSMAESALPDSGTDDDSILIYNMVNANRINHVVDRPQVALHFDGDGAGGDIVVFTGTARRADDIPPPHENQAFMAKYGDSLARVSDSAEEFGKKFPVPLRIEVTRTRGR